MQEKFSTRSQQSSFKNPGKSGRLPGAPSHGETRAVGGGGVELSQQQGKSRASSQGQTQAFWSLKCTQLGPWKQGQSFVPPI